MQGRADRLRALPLEAVLLRSGAIRDPADKAKWHTGRGVISITGAKFMNWNRSVGGGGAIDLAMHLGGLRFMEALEWLSRNFPALDPSDPPPVLPPPLLLPFPYEEKLSGVRRYLYDCRRLPAALVEPLIAGGSILFCIAMIDILSPAPEARRPGADLGAVPLGTPLIAGPAVLTTSLAIIQEYGLWATLIAVVVNIALCGALLGLSGVLLRFLGRPGSRALSKITSLLLGAIAVMLIRKGIVDLLGR
jgi:hypothetical protein